MLPKQLEKIAYIQTDEMGLPYSVNGMAAAKGFAFLGYTVRLFQRAELPSLPLAPNTIVVGGMGTVRAALEQLGVHPPSHLSIPAILKPYLGRESWRTTIHEVRTAGRFPVFLKPYDQAKVFSGQVIMDRDDLDRLTTPRQGFPIVEQDFPILAQEPVSFKSEWRVFVVRGVIVGVNFYHGDPLILPATHMIKMTIGAYQQAPAGYSADFGITEKGDTLLIEINDGYSLGHGALTANLYAELLQARWLEMTST